MKKIVVIMIVGLYIGSIFLVNFFGLQYVAHELNVYVTKLECNTISDLDGNAIEYYALDTDPDTQMEIKCFKVIFKAGEYTTDAESLATNPNVYKINCNALPENANNKSVNLVYDTKNEGTLFVIDPEEMTITFLKGNNKSVTILIVAADGSHVKEEIKILVKKQ